MITSPFLPFWVEDGVKVFEMQVELGECFALLLHSFGTTTDCVPSHGVNRHMVQPLCDLVPWSSMFVRALSSVSLCGRSRLPVFLISVAVVFSRSHGIWGGGHADTFVSSCSAHTDWSIYLPSGAENAVSVNDSIFSRAGWEPFSCNMWNISAL